VVPVVLIHGLWDSAKDLRTIADHLRRAGRETHCMELIPNDGSAPIEALADQVSSQVRAALVDSAAFDIVGFSMGGLVGRYYAQRLDTSGRVRKLVTISSPHAGTWTAWALRKPGIRQMRPGSSFLRDLDRDAESLRDVEFTSVWTPFDLLVVPARSSAAGTRKIKVTVAAHRLMLTSRRVLRVLDEILEDRPKT
jgi:triacylglycerol lipase